MTDMNSYLEFYDLERDPFELTPDPDQVYVTGGYREALAIFLYAIKSRKGFAAFYGEKGIGKTTLIRQVESGVDANTRILTLSEGNIPYHCLLKKILEKAGLPLKRESKGSMLHELYLYLIRSLAEGLNLVLIFDDAHELHPEVLEDLRLLSNLETSRSKLIQILFVGEPRLEGVLAADSMRQLRQRISIAHHIAPMTLDESMGYIVDRLRQFNKGVYSVFTPEALSLITTYAAGIPERLDRLCHNSLVEGYIRNERPVTGIVVQAVRGEAEFKTFEAQVAPVRRPVRLIDRVRGEWLMPSVARFHDALSTALASARLSPERFCGELLIPRMVHFRCSLSAAVASARRSTAQFLSEGPMPNVARFHDTLSSALASARLSPERFRSEWLIPNVAQFRHTLLAARASTRRSTAQFRGEWLIPRIMHFRCSLSAAVASARQSTERFQRERLIPNLAQFRNALSAARASVSRSINCFQHESSICPATYLHYALPAALASVLLVLAVAQFPAVDLSLRTIQGPAWHTGQSTPAIVEWAYARDRSVADRFQRGAAPSERKDGSPRVPAGDVRNYLRTSFASAKSVTVPKDATLTSLAVMHYGYSSPMILDLILEMNPEITDIDIILHGQTVRLPEITDASAILAFSESSYKIQIGTFTRQRELRDLQQVLHLKNENVEIVSRKVSPSHSWYRILIGPFASHEECLTALRKLRGNAKLVLAER
jgi:type II secretory pathway predicted ATPase ExeA